MKSMKKKINIVLIGLMGAGKTTVGKKLASVLGMPFVDVDENIERNFGKISDLFKKGEQHFRDLESQMVKRISALDHVVISTGGGVVLRAENMEALKEKGVVFYLKRPVEDIIKTIDPTDRPLIRDNPAKLYRLADERESLYIMYSDYTIDASNIDKAISSILSVWDKIS